MIVPHWHPDNIGTVLRTSRPTPSSRRSLQSFRLDAAGTIINNYGCGVCVKILPINVTVCCLHGDLTFQKGTQAYVDIRAKTAFHRDETQSMPKI